jgi:S-adenosylmethionine:tRNA ribosyltransferase-isomerase
LCEPARLSPARRGIAPAIVRAAPVGDLQRDWQFADASDRNENAAVHASLSLADFSFDLPPELIAQTPADERSASRLLHVDGAALADLQFRDLPQLLAAGDLVVFNDTRVIKARLIGQKPTGGRVEALIERIVADDRAWVHVKASHMPKIGSTLAFGGATATVLARDARLFLLRFSIDEPLSAWLEYHGRVPLPPYIARAPDANDAARYQTIYARHAGAVAAPTAGLHFDDAVVAALGQRGVGSAFVTLHVGAGTFRIPAATAEAIATTRARGGRVVAVGTTTLRALESAASDDGVVRAGAAETRLFITPGYAFRTVDRLLTNFHLPRSTLLMLVSAFAGVATIRGAYAHAIAQRYRFFSYGDAMLLERSAEPRPPGAG